MSVFAGVAADGQVDAFLARLEEEVLAHRAVRHPFLKRLKEDPIRAHQLQAFGLQHYQLVRVFTVYMTNMIARRPEWAAALRPVLDDEFGGHTMFRSHVHLYRDFLRGLGLEDRDWGRVDRLPATRAFIEGHLALTRAGDPLEALGAIGPGHELSIPAMFAPILEGLRGAGVPAKGTEYFSEHIEQDRHHVRAFNALIRGSAEEPGALERVRRGTLYSLGLREAFWSGLERAVFGGNP